MVEGTFQESEGVDGVEETEGGEGGHPAGFAVRANERREFQMRLIGSLHFTDFIWLIGNDWYSE